MAELRDRPFEEGDLDPDPVVLFGRWFEEATGEGAFEPNAVALATASAEGVPSARMEEVGRDESVAYARRRSRASQLSALASPQSRPVPDRAWLERRVAELAEEHEGAEVPVRDDWGGYRLVPAAWEFWQHRPDRLHDRFRFEPDGRGGWTSERLGP